MFPELSAQGMDVGEKTRIGGGGGVGGRGVGLKVGFGGMFINWIWDERVSEQEGLGKVEFREWA